MDSSGYSCKRLVVDTRHAAHWGDMEGSQANTVFRECWLYCERTTHSTTPFPWMQRPFVIPFRVMISPGVSYSEKSFRSGDSQTGTRVPNDGELGVGG